MWENKRQREWLLVRFQSTNHIHIPMIIIIKYNIDISINRVTTASHGSLSRNFDIIIILCLLTFPVSFFFLWRLPSWKYLCVCVSIRLVSLSCTSQAEERKIMELFPLSLYSTSIHSIREILLDFSHNHITFSPHWRNILLVSFYSKNISLAIEQMLTQFTSSYLPIELGKMITIFIRSSIISSNFSIFPSAWILFP